jgi:hypothetical protein
MRRKVNSNRNSSCGSVKLSDLDWTNWFTDTSFETHYLHVTHKDGYAIGGIHRVHCKLAENPRLAMQNGELYWLI